MSIEESKITQDSALSVIVQGVIRGQARGVYTLVEAELISKAIRLFADQKEKEKTAKKEEKKIKVSEPNLVMDGA